jgi:ATP-dependent Clp protease ATP-binding subunit ClpB
MYGAIPDLQSHVDRIIMIKMITSDTMATPVHIHEVISKMTGIPLNKLSEAKKDRFLHLDEWPRERVIGQDRAVKDVCHCISWSHI